MVGAIRSVILDSGRDSVGGDVEGAAATDVMEEIGSSTNWSAIRDRSVQMVRVTGMLR